MVHANCAKILTADGVWVVNTYVFYHFQHFGTNDKDASIV